MTHKHSIAKLAIIFLAVVLPVLAIGQNTREIINISRATTLRYKGLRISVGPERYNLKSDKSDFANSKLSMFGASAGIFMSNKKAFMSSTLGLYYSNESMAHSVDMLKANVGAGLYLARMGNNRTHLFEPYVSLSLSGVHSTIYGSRMDLQKINGNQEVPYSNEELPLCKVNSIYGLGGLGVEYQLAGEKNSFLHFFAEVQYGQQLTQTTSRAYFNNSSLISPMVASFGVTVGKFR